MDYQSPGLCSLEELIDNLSLGLIRLGIEHAARTHAAKQNPVYFFSLHIGDTLGLLEDVEPKSEPCGFISKQTCIAR